MLEYGGQIDVIYTDFEKAFDRVPQELSTRRRAKGESLQAVNQVIRRLVALAFAGQSDAKPGSVYEIVASDAFLVAIDNPATSDNIITRSATGHTGLHTGLHTGHTGHTGLHTGHTGTHLTQR